MRTQLQQVQVQYIKAQPIIWPANCDGCLHRTVWVTNDSLVFFSLKNLGGQWVGLKPTILTMSHVPRSKQFSKCNVKITDRSDGQNYKI